jgi:hypothetical protein
VAPTRAADNHADPVRGHRAQVEFRVTDCLHGAHHGELRRPVHPTGLLVVESLVQRVEVGLGGDARPESLRVEERDMPCRRLARGDQVPEPCRADAAWCDHTDSGDDDASAHLRPSYSISIAGIDL